MEIIRFQISCKRKFLSPILVNRLIELYKFRLAADNLSRFIPFHNITVRIVISFSLSLRV